MNLLPFFSSSRQLVPRGLPTVRDSVGSFRLSPAELRVLETALHRGFVTAQRNPEPAFPVVLGIDNSGSMQGIAIDELNRAIQDELVAELQQDPLLARPLAIGLVGFSSSANRAFEFLHPLAPPADFRPPTIVARTGTPHCQRLTEVIPMLGQVSEAMRKAFEVPVRHAWYFDFTDGEAMDLELHEQAQHASKVLAPESGIECFFFGVGPKANMAYLHTLEQPGKAARPLASIGQWRQFFRWLNQSIRLASRSMVGDEIELPDWDGGPSFRVRT